MSYITDFALHIFKEHHAELCLRKGEVHVWPETAWDRLSDEEHEFIHNHRHALRAIVRDGRQPRLPDKNTVSAQLSGGFAVGHPTDPNG
jgi:hypothetical protein